MQKIKNALNGTLEVTIFVESGIRNGSYTMMATPMKTLELYYPVIQFSFNKI